LSHSVIGVIKHWIDYCNWFLTPDFYFNLAEHFIKATLQPAAPAAATQLMTALAKRKVLHCIALHCIAFLNVKCANTPLISHRWVRIACSIDR
jgi:hypothetical protein